MGKVALIEQPKGSSFFRIVQLLQFISAEKYRGKRVRLTGFIKAENAVWFRLAMGSSKGRKTLQYKRISPTSQADKDGWYRVQIVQDIPILADKISFGCGLKGKGPMWCDDFKSEITNNDAPRPRNQKTKQPKNKKPTSHPTHHCGLPPATAAQVNWQSPTFLSSSF